MLFSAKDPYPLSFVLLAGGMVAVVHEDEQWILPEEMVVPSLRFMIEPVFGVLSLRYALRVDWKEPAGKEHHWTLGPYTHDTVHRERLRLLRQLSPATSPIPVPSAPRRRKRGWIAAALLAVAGLVWFATTPSTSSDSTPLASALEPTPGPVHHGALRAYSTPEVRADGALEPAGLKTLATLAEKSGIALWQPSADAEQTAPTFYVFTRPACEDCAPLREALGTMPLTFRPIVLPSGFQQDASGGESRAVSQAYCAGGPDNWRLLFRTRDTLPDSFATCNWKDRAEMALLTGILSSAVEPDAALPIIVAPNGAVHQGAIHAEDPARALTAWLEANSSPSGRPNLSNLTPTSTN